MLRGPADQCWLLAASHVAVLGGFSDDPVMRLHKLYRQDCLGTCVLVPQETVSLLLADTLNVIQKAVVCWPSDGPQDIQPNVM